MKIDYLYFGSGSTTAPLGVNDGGSRQVSLLPRPFAELLLPVSQYSCFSLRKAVPLV
jgi:hypothetical protein